MAVDDYTGVEYERGYEDADATAEIQRLGVFSEIDLDEDLEWSDDEGVPYSGENEVFVAIKWVADGASTLPEAANKLRAYAEYLDTLSAEDWELVDVINNGQGVAVLLDADEDLTEIGV